MNRKILSTGLALMACFGVFAQSKTAIKFSQGITKELANKHLSILASDEYEGRETGTKGAWMAADYIKNYFKSIGLRGPVGKKIGIPGDYFQSIDLVKYELAQSILTVNGETKEQFKDFVILPSKVGIKGFTFNAPEIVFAGAGTDKQRQDFTGMNVDGKVVMVMTKYYDLKYLTDHNALAIIIVDPDLDNASEEQIARYKEPARLVFKNEDNVARINKQKLLSSISISLATAKSIFKAAGLSNTPVAGLLKVPISATAMKKETPVRAENVLGFLEGSDPKLKKEVLVITGHYDHIGISESGKDRINNGADDDGSGTTGVLMIADAFSRAKKAGYGPKRSILFMTVVGEEKGLWGSDWYSEHPVFPLENTITNLNIDMIGRGDAAHATDNNFVYIIGSSMLSSDLDRVSKKANKDYVDIKLDETYNNRTDPNRFYYRSDHYNFAKHGIPVIFYFNGVHQDYHQPGDEVSKIDFPMLAKRTKLVYFTAWELANGAKRPIVDKNDDGTPIK